MKKDYLPIKENEKELTEINHIKQFWRSHWIANSVTTSPENIWKDKKYSIMQHYLRKLAKDTRILDSGCGCGSWTVALALEGFNVVGFDIDWQVLKEASKHKSSSARFVSGDVRQLSFKDEYFNVYYSWGTFEHFENGLGDCIKEARRVLRPGGLLFLSIPYQNWRHILRDSQPLECWDENCIRGQGYQFPMSFYQWRLRPQELRRELEMHGFRVLTISPIEKEHGIFRLMHHEFRRLKPGTIAYGFLRRMLYLVLPSTVVAHMLLAVAQRQ